MLGQRIVAVGNELLLAATAQNLLELAKGEGARHAVNGAKGRGRGHAHILLQEWLIRRAVVAAVVTARACIWLAERGENRRATAGRLLLAHFDQLQEPCQSRLQVTGAAPLKRLHAALVAVCIQK
jgi:hypothetical protein